MGRWAGRCYRCVLGCCCFVVVFDAVRLIIVRFHTARTSLRRSRGREPFQSWQTRSQYSSRKHRRDGCVAIARV
ncbi:hypothetical protein B0T13DRAFT_310011 [Neurospora crassa]|nr:hypothetical protein B0T13DRAFT_310011 [Neurospora crassa]